MTGKRLTEARSVQGGPMGSSYLFKYLRISAATLVVILLLPVMSALAQTQSEKDPKSQTNIEELKQKLLQLEQAIAELKSQINNVEVQTANNPTTGVASDLAIRPAVLRPEKTANAITPSPRATKPDAVTPTPGQKSTEPENTLEVYGLVMLDMGYQFKQNDPAWFDVIRPVKLPAFKDEFAPDGRFFSGVRQSRFGVKSSIPTALGDLKTIFEFELYGTGVDAGQTTFRLRHAYGEIGQFGAGQYWSPFMDADIFANQLEYWGPNGVVNFRNVQFRWMPIRGDSRVTLAIERPGASADQGIYADRIALQGVKPKLEWPDFSWEARYGGRKWGYVEIAGILRQLKWVDTNHDQVDLSGSDFGWGLNLTSNVKFGKTTTGKFAVVYGEGIQNYMNDAPTDVGVRNNFGDRVTPIKGVALPLLGISAFLDHNWTERFSTAAGYSMLDIHNSDGQTADAFNQGHYALVNLLWNPVQNFTAGGEFQFGRRLNFRDGFNVNDYRLQISLKYNFSKLLKF